MYSVISKLGLTVTLDLDKLVTLQLLAILANPLVTLQLSHVFYSSVWYVRPHGAKRRNSTE